MSAVPFPPCMDGAAVTTHWQAVFDQYATLLNRLNRDLAHVMTPVRDVLGVEPGATGWARHGRWWMPYPPEPVDLATVEGYAGA